MEFLNYAHRGDSEHFPQNTMMSFFGGVNAGCNAIETDVRRTRDGVLVLFHDDNMLQTTGVEGKICDFTWDELSRLTVKKKRKINGEDVVLEDRICRLDEFLSHFAFRPLHFAIELKTAGTEEDICRLIRENGIEDRTTVTSFHMEYILNVRRIDPGIRTGFLTSTVTPEILQTLLESGIEELCPRANLVTPETVEYWHGIGLGVRAWGVTDEALMRNMVIFGADGTTCNDTPALAAFLREYNKK